MFPAPLRRAAVVLAAVAAVHISPTYGAVAEDARELLEGMAEAVHELNYQGTFIYRHDGHMQTMRLYHGVYADGEKARLVSLSGPRREVLRDDQSVTCLLPQGKSLVVDEARRGRSFPISVPTNLDGLSAHYRVEVEGTDRVADRDAFKIVLRPADRYRYGQNLWVAQESRLPLRSELVDDQGEPVEQLMFTDLEVYDGPLPKTLLEPDVQGQDWVRKEYGEEAAQQADADQWQITQLPPGFEKRAHLRHGMPAAAGGVEHLVFSDGLASVSVFIETGARDENRLTGLSHMGAVHAFGRQIDGRRIIVVGEVPAETVKLIAQGIEPAGANGG